MLVHIYYILIPIFLVVAALFAATEAALFSLTASQLEQLKNTRASLSKRIRALIQKPESLLSTLIIGNETISVLISGFVVTLIELHFSNWGEKQITLVSILISSSLLLTVSEILPKIVAFRLPVLAASFLVYPATWMHTLFTPLRNVFLMLSERILRLLKIRATAKGALSEKEFLTLVEAGAESGSLDSVEKEMIYNVFQISDQPVSSIMTPWDAVFTLPEGLSTDEALVKVREKTYSRIPVLSKTSHVLGILYTKELLKLLLDKDPSNDEDAIRRATFPPYIVSTHKRISKLFREFKQKKMHIALVVDEYGRYLGVITLEDILNTLFQTRRKAEVKST